MAGSRALPVDARVRGLLRDGAMKKVKLNRPSSTRSLKTLSNDGLAKTKGAGTPVTKVINDLLDLLSI